MDLHAGLQIGFPTKVGCPQWCCCKPHAWRKTQMKQVPIAKDWKTLERMQVSDSLMQGVFLKSHSARFLLGTVPHKTQPLGPHQKLNVSDSTRRVLPQFCWLQASPGRQAAWIKNKLNHTWNKFHTLFFPSVLLLESCPYSNLVWHSTHKTIPAFESNNPNNHGADPWDAFGMILS